MLTRIAFPALMCCLGAIAEDGVKLNVCLPNRISINKNLLMHVIIKNDSSSAFLVPEYFLGGNGCFFEYDVKDSRSNSIKPVFVPEFAFSPRARNVAMKSLESGSEVFIDAKFLAKDIFIRPGKYTITFTWKYTKKDVNGKATGIELKDVKEIVVY